MPFGSLAIQSSGALPLAPCFALPPAPCIRHRRRSLPSQIKVRQCKRTHISRWGKASREKKAKRKSRSFDLLFFLALLVGLEPTENIALRKQTCKRSILHQRPYESKHSRSQSGLKPFLRSPCFAPSPPPCIRHRRRSASMQINSPQSEY